MAENKQTKPLGFSPAAIDVRDHFISLAFVECVRNDLDNKRFQHATVGDYAVRYADAVMRSREKPMGKVTVVAVGKPEGTAPEEPGEVPPVQPPPAPVVVPEPEPEPEPDSSPDQNAPPVPPPATARNPSIKTHLKPMPALVEV